MFRSQELSAGSIKLARTTFAPEHYVDGKLLPTAISSQDLKERGFSVDQCQLARISVIRKRVSKQTFDNPTRTESLVSIIELAAILPMVLSLDGDKAFVVKVDPIRGNAAHACIFSAKKDRTPSQIRGLRRLLIPLLEESLMPFDDFIERLSSMPDRRGFLKRARRAAAHFASYRHTD